MRPNPHPTADPNGRPKWPRTRIAAILIVAAALRLYGVGFGLPALLDPDEPIFLLSALHMLKDQTLDPGWFGHPGTTTIYALALVIAAVCAVGLATGRFADAGAIAPALFHDPSLVVLPGRLVSVAAGTVCVALVFVLARRMFGRGTAQVAALLAAVDPLQIRYAQIIRTDVHASVFMLLAMIAAVAIARRGGWRDHARNGMWAGLACATKWPAAIVLVSAVGAHFAGRPGGARARWPMLLVAGLAAGGTLLLVSPFLLFDAAKVAVDLGGEARTLHPGATGHGLLRNAWWYLHGPLWISLGPVGAALATFGSGRVLARAPRAAAILLGVLAAFWLAISAQGLVWERWIVPVLPILSILAAVGIVTARRVATARWGATAGALFAAVLLIGNVGPCLVRAHGFAEERAGDTRLAASRWIAAHAPAGRTVLVEHFAFDLLDGRWRLLFPAGDRGCVDPIFMLSRQIDNATVERWRAGRAIVDLGTLPPHTLSGCRADYAVFVDADRYASEGAAFAAEQRNYATIASGGRLMASFYPSAGRRGGPVVRIWRLATAMPHRATASRSGG